MKPGILLKVSLLSTVLALFMTACGSGTTPSSVSENNQTYQTATNKPSQVPTTIDASLTPTPAVIQGKVLVAEDVAMGTIQASQKIESLAFDMSFSMSLSLPTDEGTRTMAMEQTGVGLINLADKQMSLDMNVAMDISNEGRQNATAQIYATDGWLYMKTTIPGGVDQWTKIKLTDEMWAVQSQFTSMIDFLKSPSGIQLMESEMVQGIDCYVIDIAPNMASLSDWAMGQTQQGQTGTTLNEGVSAEAFQNLSVKEWIAKDTMLPVKAIVEIVMDMSADSSISNTDNAMEINASVTFHDYGTPVNFQLPSEAASAKEITTNE